MGKGLKEARAKAENHLERTEESEVEMMRWRCVLTPPSRRLRSWGPCCTHAEKTVGKGTQNSPRVTLVTDVCPDQTSSPSGSRPVSCPFWTSEAKARAGPEDGCHGGRLGNGGTELGH